MQENRLSVLLVSKERIWKSFAGCSFRPDGSLLGRCDRLSYPEGRIAHQHCNTLVGCELAPTRHLKRTPKHCLLGLAGSR